MALDHKLISPGKGIHNLTNPINILLLGNSKNTWLVFNEYTGDLNAFILIACQLILGRFRSSATQITAYIHVHRAAPIPDFTDTSSTKYCC